MPALPPDVRVFFVGGPPKSGTTWLQHLLDAHPALACRGEGHLGRTLVPVLKAALEGYNKKIGAYNQGLFSETAGFPTFGQDELRAVVRCAADQLLGAVHRASPGVALVGEKTPANMAELPLLDWLFPGCPLLCTVRDPRDGFASNWRQTQRVNPAYIAETHGGSMASFARLYARQWARMVEAGEAAAASLPERVALVRYEDLHAQPLETLQPLFALLGVDDSPETVAACVEAARFDRLSGGRRRGQESGASFFRKGVVGDWSGTLEPEAVAAIGAVAGPAMQRWGYEPAS